MYYIRRQKKRPPTVFLYVETIKRSSTPARNTFSSSQLSTTLGRIWVVICSVSYYNGCDFTSSELDVSIEFENRRPTSVVRSLFNTLPVTPSGFAEIKSQKPRDGQSEYFGHVVDRQQSQHVGCYATLVIDVELAGGCRSRRCPSVVSVDVAVYGLHGWLSSSSLTWRRVLPSSSSSRSIQKRSFETSYDRIAAHFSRGTHA